MAAANESQGLKIAVAAFITLTVILTVSCYFLYSNGASAEARLQSVEESLRTKTKAESLALNQYDTLRAKIGTNATEYDPAVGEVDASMKKYTERVTALQETVNAAVTKAQQNGAQGPELEDAKQNVQKAISSLQSEPKKNFISVLDRMTELMESLSLLTTELAVNYVGVRRTLESATSVNKQGMDVQTKAATDSHAETIEEQKRHEAERGTLLTKVDQLQTALDKLQGEAANLRTQLAREEEDYTRKIDGLATQLREKRDQLERNNENILDRPDGYVTYVDYETAELLVSVNRHMGARPQMKMTIFDAQSPGIPTEKPKGSIELTGVGETNSRARIVKTNSSIDPIRVGDIVYSAAWSPNQPTRFALVGKLDVNRDSRDDRAELKRMIHEAGGVVDFDLPPVDLGRETGALAPRIDWYVIDDRMPIRAEFKKASDSSLASEAKTAKRVGEVTKEARLLGIRPMTIGKLLAYLGYDMNSPILGRTEVSDPNAMKRLVAPRRKTDEPGKAKAEGEAAETKKDAADAEEMKKDEPAADDDRPKAATKKAAAKKAASKKKAAEDEEQ